MKGTSMSARKPFKGVCVLVVLLLTAISQAGRGQTGADAAVNVQFLNQTGGPVSLFVVTSQGEKPLLTVKDGEKSTLTTSVGLILIARTGDKEVARYRPGVAGEVSITLGSPAALKPSAPTVASTLTDKEITDLVAFHDRVRKDVGTKPVTWSPELAAFAQAWADELARTGTFQHRPHQPGPWQQKYGENIAYFQGEPLEIVVTKAAEVWYDEKKDYTAGTPIPADFSTFKAGHYTQMVWADTTSIGAGKATIKVGDLKGAQVIVCNYNPPGNFIGKTPY